MFFWYYLCKILILEFYEPHVTSWGVSPLISESIYVRLALILP